MSFSPQPQRPNIGVVLLLIQNEKILLQKRKGSDGLEGFYAPIAGKVDHFESPSQAMIREASEEAGVIIIRPEDLTLACTLHWANRRGQDAIEFYYTVSQYSGIPKIMEPDRAELIDFFPLHALPENTVSSIPRILKAIDGNAHYLEW